MSQAHSESQSAEQHLQAAQQALHSGDLSEAALRCARGLEETPDHTGLSHLLARVLLRQGRFEDVRTHLERTLANDPARPVLRYQLGQAWMGLGDMASAETQFEKATLLKPDLLPATLQLGVARWRQGKGVKACGAFLEALRMATSKGAAQRYPALQDPEIQRLLDYAIACVRQSREEIFDGVLGPIEATHGKEALARIRGAINVFLKKTEPHWDHPNQRPALMLIPGLQPRRYFEREEFDWIPALEAATPFIRDEMRAVLASGQGTRPYLQLPADHHESERLGELNANDTWSSIPLIDQGERIAGNLDRCPKTEAALSQIPLMRITAHAPDVQFSILHPKTRIPRHFGSINGRLIVHLPLIVPANCGALSVADEAREWEEGKCLIFDDSFEHEAWNDSDGIRVILRLDIWNPQLSTTEREALSGSLAAINEFHVRALGRRLHTFD